MRALIQRVSQAKVVADSAVTGEIGSGLVVFIGIGRDDTEVDATYLVRKITNARVFPDEAGRMERSVRDSGGSLLIVSQFTLYGDTRKGNRPSYSDAALPDKARILYDFFVRACQAEGINVQTGVFQAHMEVSLVNDGPVTLLFHSDV